MAYFYEKGLSGEKNYKKALELYEKSAQQNNVNSLIHLGNLYYNGEIVKQDYLQAKKYYEIAGKQNSSCAWNNLGNLYENGYGVEKDYKKAKLYYESATLKNDSNAFLNLGNIFKEGKGVPIDYLKAKFYFQKSADLGNSFAYVNIGCLYFHGEGVSKDYRNAKENFEKGTKLNNSAAFVYLGKLYYHGYYVKKNYSKAKECFEKASNMNYSEAYLKLGKLYLNGFGVEKDITKAIKNYELAAQLDNSYAQFIFSSLYSTGDQIKIDIPKATQCLLNCIEKNNEKIIIHNYIEKSVSSFTRYNKYFYRSFNNLGLICLLYSKDFDKACEYIKRAALNEYPFGQNNFGLLNELYLNDIEKAKYMYERSSEHNFPLAEFNLSIFYEKNNQIEKSVDYLIRASDHINEPLKFHGHHHYDKRLEISKLFVICLANLKLTDYFLANFNLEEARKYFIRIFTNLQNKYEDESYKFRFKYNEKDSNNVFSYLKLFILNFPLFNLTNQPNLNVNLNDSSNLKQSGTNDIDLECLENVETHPNIIESENVDEFVNSRKNEGNGLFRNIYNYIKGIALYAFNYSNNDSKEKFIFEDSGELFDFVILIEQIKECISIMTQILYQNPFNILFGRINIESKKFQDDGRKMVKDIKDEFYEGFFN